MTDRTHEVDRAHHAPAAPAAPAAVPDRRILGAVRTGLMLVPADEYDAVSSGAPDRDRDRDVAPRLAVRRRTGS